MYQDIIVVSMYYFKFDEGKNSEEAGLEQKDKKAKKPDISAQIREKMKADMKINMVASFNHLIDVHRKVVDSIQPVEIGL